MSFITPNWNARTKYLLSHLNETEIRAVEEKYAQAKCIGIRAALVVVTGSGALLIAKEAGKGAIQSTQALKITSRAYNRPLRRHFNLRLEF